MYQTSTVFVFEFFTGGGWPSGDLPEGLAAEALGMLWALLTDFRRWGMVRTMTSLDPRFEERISGLNRKSLPADIVVPALPGNYHETYHALLQRCDAVLIIAPETDGILANLTASAELAGIPLLCSDSASAATAGNKAECNRLFGKAKLPIPQSLVSSFAAAPEMANRIGYPLVIKPVDGIGSEGVSLISTLAELPAGLALLRRATISPQILLQSFVHGIHASASLLVTGGRCIPMSLNRQLIEAGLPFRYQGSQVPLICDDGNRALDLACSAVRLIPGLNGYVGVDLVLADEGPRLIEINPRLTTSYIGLRQVSQTNLAQAIWNACINGVLPDRVPLTGEALIRKDDHPSWNLRDPTIGQ